MRRYARTLVTAALTITVVSGTAGWVVGNTQQAVTGPPPGTASWRSDHTLGRELPDPERDSPASVARFFAGLTDTEQQTLALRHPLVVGNLDGAPAELRYRANARALRASHDPRYAHLANDPARRILAFDPRDRGQVAEVFGDLASAGRVSVVVPGSDIDAGTFDRTTDVYGTPAGMARSLYARTGPGTAVIAWAGYTTPVGLGPDAARGTLAEAGSVRLTRFTDGLAAAGTPVTTVFCHSYGSVVCGLAAPRLHAADLVVLGSPGMRADNVADLRTGARVWAAKDPGDWIGKVPHVEFAGLGHGADPASPGFGARRVPARDAKGHTGYFAPGTESLRAFTAIATGSYGYRPSSSARPTMTPSGPRR